MRMPLEYFFLPFVLLQYYEKIGFTETQTEYYTVSTSSEVTFEDHSVEVSDLEMTSDEECCSCRDTWHGFAEKCYKIFDSTMTWSSAQENCSKMNASLAVMDSRHKDMISSWLYSNSLWIGIKATLNNRSMAREFRTENGELILSNNTYWNIGEPNNVAEDCVKMNLNGMWDDVDCGSKMHYICQTNTTNRNACRYSWNLIDGTCYRLVRLKNSWLHAFNDCLAREAILVKVTSNEIKDELLSLISNTGSESAWIGLIRRNHRNNEVFTWVDGAEATWTNWKGRQPEEICVQLVRTGNEKVYAWNDTNCEKELPFVCELEEIGFTETQDEDYTTSASSEYTFEDHSVEHSSLEMTTDEGSQQYETDLTEAEENQTSSATVFIIFITTCIIVLALVGFVIIYKLQRSSNETKNMTYEIQTYTIALKGQSVKGSHDLQESAIDIHTELNLYVNSDKAETYDDQNEDGYLSTSDMRGSGLAFDNLKQTELHALVHEDEDGYLSPKDLNGKCFVFENINQKETQFKENGDNAYLSMVQVEAEPNQTDYESFQPDELLPVDQEDEDGYLNAKDLTANNSVYDNL